MASIHEHGVSLHLYGDKPILGYKEFAVNDSNYIYLGDDRRVRADMKLRADDGMGVQIYSNDDNTEALQDEEEEDFELSSYKALTGFRVRDDRAGALGEISGVDESSANVLLYIDKEDGEELILPYHDDFLVDFNLKKRTLTLHLPDGLVELNK